MVPATRKRAQRAAGGGSAAQGPYWMDLRGQGEKRLSRWVIPDGAPAVNGRSYGPSNGRAVWGEWVQ